ncbi:MAG: tRNA pseudouridine(38-40) synthase TruA [Rickettsia sp.]|nr:tRNA pseudouridine(38-40) synthase TruA [Rickettsia sp.]
MKYKITIEYLGSNLSGWQKQKSAPSVQEKIEDAIYILTKERVEVVGAGRTDAGVHAYAQVAHFSISKELECYKLKASLNYFLRFCSIVIIECVKISEQFHARFSAKKRHYLYKILNRDTMSILDKDFKYWIKTPLSIQNMQKAAQFFIGTHNFNAFRASGCQAKSPIRTIDEVKIIVQDITNINIYIIAESFLQRMVRKIVGSLIMVGKNKCSFNKIPNIISSQDKSKTGPTAPATGLYLLKIDY